MRLFDRRGLREAVVITIALWILTYLVFLTPSLSATGRVSPDVCGLFLSCVVPGLVVSPLIYVLLCATEGWAKAGRILLMGFAVVGLAWGHSVLDVMASDFFIRTFLPARSDWHPVSVSGSFIIYIWLYGLYAAILGLLQSNYAMQDRERQLLEARTAAHQAQLAALRFQLNPHFLFNTLNAISSLIVTHRNAEAEAMMEKLSEFLRATLGADPHDFVTLDEELNTVRAYLDIERVRFGRRLAVEMSCPAELCDAAVPSFVLQPLVENAIKYAVAPSVAPVTIRIEALALEDGQLMIRVEDDGAPGDMVRGGSGVGLSNVRARLKALYGGLGALAADAREHGFVCTIWMPHEHQAAGAA